MSKLFLEDNLHELNSKYYDLFLALSDVRETLTNKFYRILTSNILKQYMLEYKMLALDFKFDYKLTKRDKKIAHANIKKLQKEFHSMKNDTILSAKKETGKISSAFSFEYKPKYEEDNI